MSTVYLIHMESRIAHAQHYIGYTRNLSRRISQHANGTGSPLLKAANHRAIKWTVVRTWAQGTRTKERYLKSQKNARRLCPICSLTPCNPQPKCHEYIPCPF
jgi:predicted GIY-YIG superfamily endonuclease